MLLWTEHERKRYKQFLLILLAGIALWGLKVYPLLTAIGVMFLIVNAINVVFTLFGHILARFMFKEVYPKSIRELKHTDKQYQYILKIGKEDIYTYVYNKPLKDVNVRCWVFMSSYFIEVTST